MNNTIQETWSQIRELSGDNPNVLKFVYEKDNAVAESVLYKYPTYEERTVICCSTQSGCPIGCRFCGAGDHFVRSLSSDEIVAQVDHLFEAKNIDSSKVDRLQIMFMSMGEPMLNFSNLEGALRELHHKYPKAALLISTSGPDVDYRRLISLSVEIPTIGLQFSVHETTDEARDELIPFKKKLMLEEITLVGERWWAATKRTPFFNYCVHEKNNTDADVSRLRTLFEPRIWQATLSVICERGEHIAAANERQRDLVSDFMQKLMRLGYSTRMFDPAGQDDIGGGCGQLWFVQDWMKNNPNLVRDTAGTGLPVVHTPS